MTYHLTMNSKSGEFHLNNMETREVIEIGDYIEGRFTGMEEAFEVKFPEMDKIMTRYKRPFMLTFSAMLSDAFEVYFDYTPLTRRTFIQSGVGLDRNYAFTYVARSVQPFGPHNTVHFRMVRVKEIVNA